MDNQRIERNNVTRRRARLGTGRSTFKVATAAGFVEREHTTLTAASIFESPPTATSPRPSKQQPRQPLAAKLFFFRGRFFQKKWPFISYRLIGFILSQSGLAPLCFPLCAPPCFLVTNCIVLSVLLACRTAI